MPTAFPWPTGSGARYSAVSGLYDFDKGEYVGMLADRWEVDKADNNVWTFHLKRGLKRHNDGKELTADDVVHSITRINTDPQSKQKQNTGPINETIALDTYTVKIVTKKPTASLLEYLFDRVIITAKDLYDKHGARDADRKFPWGWGPYKLKELVIGQRIVLEKDNGHPAAKPQNPDTLIFTIMREPEQRVTALINNEIQIAQFIPPHLSERVSRRAQRKAGAVRLGRDHVPGHESQVQAVGQCPAAPGGLLRNRPGPDHQERAERPGGAARWTDRSGPIWV